MPADPESCRCVAEGEAGQPEKIVYPDPFCSNEVHLARANDGADAQGQPTTPDARGFAHFLRLADAGRSAAASSGERAARELAKCILKNAGQLDDSALGGMHEFARMAAFYPSIARDMVR